MFTMTQLIEKVREFANQYPDGVYSNSGSCCYTIGTVKDGPEQCGCIFGQAIKALGGTIEEKIAQVNGADCTFVEGCTGMPNITALLETRFPYVFNTASYLQLNWCIAVQRYQDSQMKWGDAIKFADRRYGY